MSWHQWAPYVPVAVRRIRAAKKIKTLGGKGFVASPVEASGREIARTFWGRAWCRNLESYSDFSNRLPRGRTYIRNGSVLHLHVDSGRIKALVSGSDLYEIDVSIAPVPAKAWSSIRKECTGKIASLVSLLRGELPGPVMEVVTRHGAGLFPSPGEIRMKCSCPDWAVLCKHLAAVLYGVGVRLDEKPELLFLLRGVDHVELVTEAAAAAGSGLAATAPGKGKALGLDASGLSELFGIEVEAEPEVKGKAKAKPRPKAKPEPEPEPEPKPEARAGGQPPALPSGATITSRELAAMGISAAARQGWLMEGVLVRTPARGVYLATSRTARRVAAYLEWKGVPRGPG